jgi:hypothetical protein
MIQNEETDSPIKGVAMTTEMANRILENSGRALIEELNGDLRNSITVDGGYLQAGMMITASGQGGTIIIIDGKNKTGQAIDFGSIDAGFMIGVGTSGGKSQSVYGGISSFDEYERLDVASYGISGGKRVEVGFDVILGAKDELVSGHYVGSTIHLGVTKSLLPLEAHFTKTIFSHYGEAYEIKINQKIVDFSNAIDALQIYGLLPRTIKIPLQQMLGWQLLLPRLNLAQFMQRNW